MSWLAERKCHYFFKCASDHTTVETATCAEQDKYYGQTTACAECGAPAPYQFSEIDDADKLKQKSIVEYDQNGRKAFRITMPDGSHQHISATKMHYKKTGRIEPQYTRAFTEALEKEQQMHMHRTDENRRKAGATAAKFKEMLKDMPDGEYTSDGSNAKQIK